MTVRACVFGSLLTAFSLIGSGFLWLAVLGLI
jgi:hypothetical protein